MLLHDTVEAEGQFWLPGSPDGKTSGKLTIETDGSVNLALANIVSDDFENHIGRMNVSIGSLIPPMRIVGYASPLGNVTLDNCYAKSLSLFPGGQSPTNYAVGRVLSGAQYESGEEVELNELQFNVEGLDDWVGVSGFTVGNSQDFSKIWVNYDAPDDINLMRTDDLEIDITYAWQHPGWSLTQTEATIKQTALIRLTSQIAQPFGKLIETALRVRDFVSLGIGRNVLVTQMTGFSNALGRQLDNGTFHRQQLKFYFRDHRRRDSEEVPLRDSMLVNFAATQNSATSHIEHWLDSYAKHYGPISRFFDEFGRRSEELADRFLRLFQVVETLHKQTSSETKMPKAALRERIKFINKRFDDDQQLAKVLVDAYSRTNDLSARERLIRVFNENLDFEVCEKTMNEVCATIARTRAKLNHEAGANNVETVMSHNVWAKTNALDAIIRIWLMKLSGFDDDAIRANLERVRRLRDALNYMFQRDLDE